MSAGIIGYHGTSDADLRPYVGLCVTTDRDAAKTYARYNGGDVVLAVEVETDGLVWLDVEYDYDGCEPILDGIIADVVEYLDCDEEGRTHRTWLHISEAAVAATSIYTV